MVDRCAKLLLRLDEEFDARPRRPERRPLVRDRDRPGRDRVAEHARRDRALAGLPPVDAPAHHRRRRPGLRRARHPPASARAYGHDPRRADARSIRFVRTAVVDPDSPDLAGLRAGADRVAAGRATANCSGWPASTASAAPTCSASSRSIRCCSGASSSSPTTTSRSPADRQPGHRRRVRARWPSAWSTTTSGEACDAPTRPTHPIDSVFEEATAEARVQSLPLSHLSIELGHLYIEDFDDGPDRLREHFEQVAPWAARRAGRPAPPRLPGRPRVSTCFLIDDYFGPKRSPARDPARPDRRGRGPGAANRLPRTGVSLRDADGVALAELVTQQIVAEPAAGHQRCPAGRTGQWLALATASARRGPPASPRRCARRGGWRPPVQNAANRHSIFVDVELWDEPDGRRRYSCAYLARVWQLLRLGLLRRARRAGRPAASVGGRLPRASGASCRRWSSSTRRPTPFSAYRTLLGARPAVPRRSSRRSARS